MRYAVRSHLLTVLALIACAALLLGADGPATLPATEPGLSAQDLQTLQQLETGNWRQRQSIQQQLAHRGVADSPIIAAMLAQTQNPEARARLTAVLKEIEQAKLMGTSLITMHFKDAPAKTVYAALYEQAFAPLTPTPANLLDSLPPITLDADRKPFWTVMQRLEDMTNLGTDRPAGPMVLRSGGMIVRGPQQLSGGFLVVLGSIRPFVMGNRNGQLEKYFWLDLSIYPEPKLNVQSFIPQMRIDQATDDLGNALEQRLEMANIQNNIPPGGYQVTACMQSPPIKPGTHLVRFRGTITASLALQSARFDIDNLPTAKPQSVDVSGLTLKFTGCQKANGQNGYQVSFQTPPDVQNRFVQILMSAPNMRVLDAKGNPMQAFSSSTSVNPTAGNTLAYTFSGLVAHAVAKRLIWDIPTVIRTVEIPFDFKDLNLDFAKGVASGPRDDEDKN